MASEKILMTIGRAERVNLPSLGLKRVPAKIDTGADSSVIWCSKIEFADGELRCVFFGPSSQFYSGETVSFKKSEIDLTRIANSFGHKEIRYKVRIPVEIKGRTIKGSFTLADRSSKLYPILIGRSTLHRKFIVDVSKGNPTKEEIDRYHHLREDMSEMKKRLKL